MYKWNEISLETVKTINERYHIAIVHDWSNDICHWGIVRQSEMARYETMMTHIENNWNAYSDTRAMYDACTLAYLLLGGQMTGIDVDNEIARLTKSYYGIEG